jgi:hypothetical protein
MEGVEMEKVAVEMKTPVHRADRNFRRRRLGWIEIAWPDTVKGRIFFRKSLEVKPESRNDWHDFGPMEWHRAIE